MTTLMPEEKPGPRSVTLANGREKSIFVEIPRFPALTDKMEKILKRHGVNSYHTGRGNLKSIITRTKDKKCEEEKSGIYEISCKSCAAKYRGQTCRRIGERYKEHERAFRKKQATKSAMAQHCIEDYHEIGEVKLLKEVTDRRRLDAWESLMIHKGNNLVNVDPAPIQSTLFSIEL